ncbi:MAG: MFS transporter, partial [Chloroflexota bacterium]
MVLESDPIVDPEALKLAEADDDGLDGNLWQRAFSAMSDRHFRMLYFGNMLQFGSQNMQLFIRGFLVFQLTGSFALLGTMALANAIPGVLLSPVGGVIADRAPKKTVIQLAQGFNAVNAVVLALIAWGGIGIELHFWHLFLSSFLQGGVNSLMMPARQSIISDLVGPRRLMNAIGINSSGQTLMQLFAPAVGGFLVKFLDPAAVFWTMAAMYALAMTFTMRLPAHPLFSYDRNAAMGRPGQTGEVRRRRGSFADIADGMVYVWRDPVIRALIGVNFLIVVVAMPYTMLLPGFVQAVLHKGGFEQGMLQMVQGVGAVIGSLIIASGSARGRGRLMAISSMVRPGRGGFVIAGAKTLLVADCTSGSLIEGEQPHTERVSAIACHAGSFIVTGGQVCL